MYRVDIKLVRECGLHHLSVDDRDIWLADDEIKARMYPQRLQCGHEQF